MALAQELMDPSGGPSGGYHLAMAKMQLQKEQFKEAEESIQEALQYSYQVCTGIESWSPCSCLFVAGNATNNSLFRSVCLSHFDFFLLF